MENVLEWLKGKKTYILAISIAVLGVLQGLEIFILPEWVFAVLAALGLSFIRAGVSKVSEAVKEPQ